MNPSPSSFAPPAPLRRHPFRFFAGPLARLLQRASAVSLLCLAFLPLAQAQTAKSRSALYTEIDTNLPSTTGAITAAVLRAQLKNVVASAYNTVNADAQPIDADLTAIAALTTATYGRSLLTLADAAALRTTAALVIGTDVQAFDSDLTAIAALSSNGLLSRTGAGTAAARTLTGTAAEITVTNGDGVSGNPTLSLPAALTFTGKTITGGTYASPTLTTPALGTPASGVATNLTALNATQLTTGTIPAARLPTALTSINSVTAAAVTDLALTGGSSGATFVLGQGANSVSTVTTTGIGSFQFLSTGVPQSSTGVMGVKYPFARTDTTERNVQAWTSSESGSSWKLLLTALGNATPASRIYALQTSSEGVSNSGVISLQSVGGNVSLGAATSTVTVNGTTASTSTTTGSLISAGGLGVAGAINAGGGLTIAGTVIHTLSATPASATAAGTVGTMSWDANYIYICVATNTWKRAALATW